MDNQLTDKIRNTLRIEDIIGRTVSLRKTQRGWSGLCPFHDDKAPSFHVYSDTQHYYCFGCHESGDIFTFVMKSQNLTFPEAVSLLAEEAGIDVRAETKNRAKTSHTVREIMNMAQEYFTSCFRKLPGGAAYLESRGISREKAEAFGLGYATDSWDGLKNFLAEKKVEPRMMIDAGLVIQGQRGMYDRFRGRIIFPVRDIAGRVIAFGGRSIVQGEGAKYINSPETETFRKGRNLYMLDAAGSHIREKGYSILCEGYMDTLRLHTAGFREAVASLGTSLTEEQARLLRRFSERCYICYDGDSAGKKAALRGMYILADAGLDVRVVSLPEGKDPDDFLRENPPEMFRQELEQALPLIPYHIETLRPELEDETKRKGALREIWKGVKRVGTDEALRYLASLSAVFMLPHDEMKRRILEGREVPEPSQNIPEEYQAVDNGLECAFCAMLMRSRECRMNVKQEDIRLLLTDEGAISVAKALIHNDPENCLGIWRTVGDTEKIGIISRGEIFLSEMNGDKWEAVCSGLERRRITRRIQEIGKKMTMNTAAPEEVREFAELHRKLQGLGTW